MIASLVPIFLKTELVWFRAIEFFKITNYSTIEQTLEDKNFT